MFYMGTNTCAALAATNIAWLRQALSLVENLDHSTYASSPEGLAPHRVGSHLRHVLEFYECFLDGIETLHIDYDARKRDARIEMSRYAAADKIRFLIRRLEHSHFVRQDSTVLVRMEDAENSEWQESYLSSSVSRELQALSSHTIHHFALIAMTLRLHGFPVDPTFGMAPSTLRYQATLAVAGPSEAA